MVSGEDLCTMGEGMQWFISTIADLPGEGLQYNNGTDVQADWRKSGRAPNAIDIL